MRTLGWRTIALKRVAWLRSAVLPYVNSGTGKAPHRCLIPKKLLELAEQRLQAAARRLASARDFDAFYGIVEREIGHVHGIGELMVYDTFNTELANLSKRHTTTTSIAAHGHPASSCSNWDIICGSAH